MRADTLLCGALMAAFALLAPQRGGAAEPANRKARRARQRSALEKSASQRKEMEETLGAQGNVTPDVRDPKGSHSIVTITPTNDRASPTLLKDSEHVSLQTYNAKDKQRIETIMGQLISEFQPKENKSATYLFHGSGEVLDDICNSGAHPRVWFTTDLWQGARFAANAMIRRGGPDAVLNVYGLTEPIPNIMTWSGPQQREPWRHTSHSDPNVATTEWGNDHKAARDTCQGVFNGWVSEQEAQVMLCVDKDAVKRALGYLGHVKVEGDGPATVEGDAKIRGHTGQIFKRGAEPEQGGVSRRLFENLPASSAGS